MILIYAETTYETVEKSHPTFSRSRQTNPGKFPSLPSFYSRGIRTHLVYFSFFEAAEETPVNILWHNALFVRFHTAPWREYPGISRETPAGISRSPRMYIDGWFYYAYFHLSNKEEKYICVQKRRNAPGLREELFSLLSAKALFVANLVFAFFLFVYVYWGEFLFWFLFCGVFLINNILYLIINV